MSKINHLYWRAGFGLRPAEWKSKKDGALQKAVDELFKAAKKVAPLSAPDHISGTNFQKLGAAEKKEILKKERQSVVQLNINWVKRMADPNASGLLEKMSLFWHGHFACRSTAGRLAVQQLNTIRANALGDFRSLVLGIAKDPAMIRYLNNQQNKKQQPNENFARELMELFTIGRGQYSEKDIKEAARAFTGWSSNIKGEFVFRRFAHDFGPKTFMGKSGNFNGEDIIDIILEQKTTAEYITRKIYRYFVNPQIDEGMVKMLANSFYQSNYNIEKLMRSIFESDWFYSPKNIGAKIKSPLELLVGMMKTYELSFKEERTILFFEKALGQMLFNPPNVAGWPGGSAWIDNSTLMFRLNLAGAILSNSELNFREKGSLEDKERPAIKRNIKGQTNLKPLLQLAEKNSAEKTILNLADYYLLKKPKLSPEVIKRFSPAKEPEQFVALASMRLMSLPEYQLC